MIGNKSTQEHCPRCGRSEVMAERHYANKLKRSKFLKSAAKSSLVWIAAMVLAFLELVPQSELMVYIVFALLWTSWILRVTILAYRKTYGTASAERRPDTLYICRLCGYQWTFDDTMTKALLEIDEPETLVKHGRAQGSMNDQEAPTLISDEQGLAKRTGVIDGLLNTDYSGAVLVVSIIAGLALSWLTGMIVQSIIFGNFDGLLNPGNYIETRVYSAFCFPFEALVIITGAIIGGLQGNRAGYPIKGATLGVWVGTLVAMIVGAFSGFMFENWT